MKSWHTSKTCCVLCRTPILNSDRMCAARMALPIRMSAIYPCVKSRRQTCIVPKKARPQVLDQRSHVPNVAHMRLADATSAESNWVKLATFYSAILANYEQLSTKQSKQLPQLGQSVPQSEYHRGLLNSMLFLCILINGLYFWSRDSCHEVGNSM